MKRTVLGVLLILIVTLFRLFPHPANFTPVLAMFIFGAAFFKNKIHAFLIVILSMFFSDLLVNNIIYGQYFDGFVFFYKGMFWTYLSLVLAAVAVFPVVKKFALKNIVIGSVISPIVFFILSNFGVWMFGNMYPHSFEGMMTCFIVALPFFKNTLASTLIYSTIMYGIVYYYDKNFAIDINK